MLVPIWKIGSIMIDHTSVPIPTCCFMMLQVMWRLVYSLLTAGQTMLSTTVLILFRARNNGHSMLFYDILCNFLVCSTRAIAMNGNAKMPCLCFYLQEV